MNNTPARALARYPLSWLACALILAAHAAMTWWFGPRLVMQAALIGIDILLFVFWCVFALKSRAFGSFHEQIPYKSNLRKLRRILPECAAEFRGPARECIELVEGITEQFADQASLFEIGNLLSNLVDLARANADLAPRLREFGTKEQQSRMQHLHSRQIATIENSRETLKAFSGNLTLIAADSVQAGEAVQKLKYANEGMREVMQEFEHEDEIS
jgi:hypothetical protein